MYNKSFSLRRNLNTSNKAIYIIIIFYRSCYLEEYEKNFTQVCQHVRIHPKVYVKDFFYFPCIWFFFSQIETFNLIKVLLIIILLVIMFFLYSNNPIDSFFSFQIRLLNFRLFKKYQFFISISLQFETITLEFKKTSFYSRVSMI